MSFPTMEQVANTSFVDATLFALKPCASKFLHLAADKVGNFAWYGKSLGWQGQTALFYTITAAMLVSAAICAATKCCAQTEGKKKAFKVAAGVGAATCVVALGILYKQVEDIQAYSRGWDFQYPSANISYIAQNAPFYC